MSEEMQTMGETSVVTFIADFMGVGGSQILYKINLNPS